MGEEKENFKKKMSKWLTVSQPQARFGRTSHFGDSPLCSEVDDAASGA